MSRPGKQRGDGGRDRGFILVAVLLLATLLAVMTASFAATMRSELRRTAAIVQAAEAEALADAGVTLALETSDAIIGETSNSAEVGPEGGVTVRVCRAPSGGIIAVEFEDEAGKVDLNSASGDLLAAVFRGLGADSGAASRYVDALLQYRGEGGSTGARGLGRGSAEAERRGRKSAPLDAVEEIDRVEGLPPDLRRALVPLATVYSGASGVDPDAASPDLRRILAAGENALSTDFEGLQKIPERFQARSQAVAFTLRAAGVLTGGARFVREAIVTRDERAGSFRLRSWRRGILTPRIEEALGRGSAGPC